MQLTIKPLLHQKLKDLRKKEFLDLYKPVHDHFWRFCRVLSGNVYDSEDLIQDTILTVLEGFNKIKDKIAFKSYLFSVAGNIHKMNRRRLKFNADFNEQEMNYLIDSS